MTDDDDNDETDGFDDSSACDDGDDEDGDGTVEFDMQCNVLFSFPSSFRQPLFLNC